MSRADLGERWQRVFDDTEATAAEYRDRGWEALALHPGDVNPIADEARLHVLLPGSEFDEVNDLLSGASIESVRVYAAAGETASYRLVVAEDPAAEIAVCVPTFVLDSDSEALEAAAADAGQLTLRLRPLDDRDRVEFAVDDPELFFRDPTE
ncbi:hypothetical protein FK85_01245 [Halorubrum saccharovorum]|uniref:Uncharacterized protein n=1 Tax=Halorubrum saccharovorum TaxID=2248 RepID=A0A081EVS8_9EURY|nr:hypothetical protein [Halorubrum saccharovorum]KDS91516.1 hypothetical protein FK85_01245 [Halorubrum saccharovorum]